MQVVLRCVPQRQAICFHSISFLLKELQAFLLAMLLQTRQVTPFKRDNPSNVSDLALLERSEVWAEVKTEILRGNSLSNLIMSKLARKLWYPSCCCWGICVPKAFSNLRKQTNSIFFHGSIYLVLKKFFSFFIMSACALVRVCLCVCACLCACAAIHLWVWRYWQLWGTWYGCWEPNSDLLQKPLAMESFLAPGDLHHVVFTPCLKTLTAFTQTSSLFSV